jgi:hexosaminidase
MKKILLIMLLSSITTVRGQQSINLIPEPVTVERAAGSFTLTGETSISYNTNDGGGAAELLAQRLSRPTGFTITPVKGSTGTIRLTISENADRILGAEGYTLVVSADGVVITAKKPAGLFYGMQTLVQLFPKEIESQSKATIAKVEAAKSAASWTIPCVRITDYPRFAWRGVMLDVSRHFFTKDEVMKYIDEISRLKLNTFHWHLADDQGWRIEIKSLPKLTSVGAWRVPRFGRFGDREAPKPGEAATDGGFYTQNDIREVVRYAAARNVTIVPEIDVPGHSMAAVAAYPELCCTKDTSVRVDPGMHNAEWYGNNTFKILRENTLNPSDEKVYEFLDKVFTEMASLFPGTYFHVGGDECYKGYWAKNEGCKELMKKLNTRHVEDLQGYFMNRVEQLLKAKGKKMIGWDEILEGGISPTATVMSWRGIQGGIEAAKLGHDVVMAPNTFAYIDYVQGDPSVDPPLYSHLRARKCYSFEPVPDGIDPKFILGGQANLWTEQVPTMRAIEYMAFPRVWALSEVFWSPKDKKDWNAFVPRMEAHFERADAAQIKCSHAIYDAIVKPTMKGDVVHLELEGEIAGLDIYYTIDESLPDNFSPKYTQPFDLPKGPITLRVITYRNGAPIGHMITLPREELVSRARR